MDPACGDCGAVFRLAATFYPRLVRLEAASDAAIAAGEPPVVALAEFDPARDIHPLGEVNLRVRVDPRLSQRVVIVEEVHRSRRARLFGASDLRSDEFQMYVLTEPGSSAARAVILVERDDLGAFENRIGADAAAGRADMVLGGTVEPIGEVPDLALTRIAEAGGSVADGAFLFTPFPTTRADFLAGQVTAPAYFVYGLAGIGFLFYLLAWRAMRAHRAWKAALAASAGWHFEPRARQAPKRSGVPWWVYGLAGIAGAIVAKLL